MGGVTITGPEAEVRWGYHRAARLQSYTLTAHGSASASVTATVLDADAYRLEQPDLVFRILRQNGPAWSYPIQSLSIADKTVSMTVLLQE